MLNVADSLLSSSTRLRLGHGWKSSTNSFKHDVDNTEEYLTPLHILHMYDVYVLPTHSMCSRLSFGYIIYNNVHKVGLSNARNVEEIRVEGKIEEMSGRQSHQIMRYHA